LERARNEVLWYLFRFEDRWHVSQGWHAREYKKRAADIVRPLGAQTVVELGCGVADILVHIPARTRIGVDLDLRVVRAARLRVLGRARILQGSFDTLASLPTMTVDCLIMLGWIHMVDFQTLRRGIELLSARHTIRHWLLDEYLPGKGSGFLHDTRALLEGRAALVGREQGDETRELLLFRSAN
jgi:hypothetical protein